MFLSSPDICLQTVNIIQKNPTVSTIDKYKPAIQASAGIVLIFFLIAGTTAFWIYNENNAHIVLFLF